MKGLSREGDSELKLLCGTKTHFRKWTDGNLRSSIIEDMEMTFLFRQMTMDIFYNVDFARV
jgi:hypothetical protein